MGTTGLTPPGWYADPTGRHVYRWWEGSGWTDRVGDGSTEFLDPFGHELHPTPTATTPTWSGPGPGWSVPPSAPSPSRRSGRGWLIGGLIAGGVALVALIVVAIVVVTVGATKAPIIDQDFSSGAGQFSTDSDNLVELKVVDSAYQVTIKDASSPQEARSFFDPARSAITVSAKVAELSAPAASAGGVTCYSSTDTGYAFLLSSDRQWAIVKIVDGTQGKSDILAQGTGDTGISADAVTLHLSCTGGGTDPTVVTGQVDDRPVHTGTDNEGYDQFRAAGFFVAAEKAPTILTFDDMVVKAAS
jgi:hypothetical protein